MNQHTRNEEGIRSMLKRHRAWLGLGLAFVLAAAAVLVLLPAGIRWGLERWLESHGRLQARVEDVDFNLLSGRMVVHSLLADREGEGGLRWVRAAVEIAWRPLFKKRIRFDDISVSQGRLTILKQADGALFVGGIRVNEGGGEKTARSAEDDAAAESGKDKWEFGFGNIDLQQVRVRYVTPEFTRQLLIRDAHIDPMQSWNPDSSGNFSLDMVLEQGRIQVQGSARPYSRKASVQGRIQAQRLPVGLARPWMADSAVSELEGFLNADAQFSFSMGEQIRGTLEGALDFDRLQATAQGRAEVAPMALSWHGSLRAATAADASPAFTAEGVLTGRDAAVRFASSALSASAASVRLEGKFRSGGDAQEPFIFSGQVQAIQVRVQDTQAGRTVASLQEVSAQDLNVGGPSLQADSARVEGGGLLERPPDTRKEGDAPHALQFGELTVQDIRVDMDRKRLAVGDVELRDAEGLLVRDKQGNIQIIQEWTAAPAVGEDAEASGGDGEASEADDGASAWQFAVGRAGMASSRLRFVDRSVDPAVDLSVSGIEASIQNLDSTAADPVTLDFQADLGPYASMKAQGTLKPLAPKISMDINGEVKQFSLPQVRGYAERMLGYTIESGKLYADFHLRVIQGRMDSVIKLFITQLNLERLQQAQLGPMEQSLGMPLNTALNLLRNRDKNIRLRLPVSGSLSQPDVDLGGVIAKALRSATYKAVKTAALSYFAPLGAAYLTGKLLGKAVALRLSPVEFAAGQVQLEPGNERYLDQVAEKLKDRPETQLLLCGTATRKDRLALAARGRGEKGAAKQKQIVETRLLELAQDRAEAVRAYLVDKGIASERLALCAPEILSAESAVPKVELGVS